MTTTTVIGAAEAHEQPRSRSLVYRLRFELSELRHSFSTRRRAETLTGLLLVLPALIGFLIFYAAPTLRAVEYSFTDWNLLSPARAVGWANYAKMMQDAGADALELNVYFVATDMDMTSDDVEARYLDLVAGVKTGPVADLRMFRLADLALNDKLTGQVPCYFLKVVPVDKNNLYDEVIKSGFQKYDDVYRDIPESKRPPRV